jgi:hypothetical protein
MQMNRFFSTLVCIAMLAGTSCKNNTNKEAAAEKGSPATSSTSDAHLTEYTINNEYSVSIPANLRKTSTDPKRFSLEYGDDQGHQHISIEGDTKESYEERRKKENNLEQFPFTLKGFTDMSGNGPIKQMPGYKQNSTESTTINKMPATVSEYEIMNAGKKLKLTVVCIQGSNEKMYRMILVRLADEDNSWIAPTYNSFKVVK